MFVFINIDTKLTESISFFNRIKNILAKSDQAKIAFIISRISKGDIPRSIEKYLHANIKFNLL